MKKCEFLGFKVRAENLSSCFFTFSSLPFRRAHITAQDGRAQHGRAKHSTAACTWGDMACARVVRQPTPARGPAPHGGMGLAGRRGAPPFLVQLLLECLGGIIHFTGRTDACTDHRLVLAKGKFWENKEALSDKKSHAQGKPHEQNI